MVMNKSDVVTVYKVPFSKAQLTQLTKEERALIILLGNAANQLTVFWKLVYFSTNFEEANTAHQLVLGGQTQILVRHTIGLAFEAWELIRTRYLQTAVGREYQDRLSSEGRDALENLKRYFSKSNIIYRVRNDYAFHHPENVDVESDYQHAIRDSGLDDEWNWYLTGQTINTFYFFSDMVIAQGMARAAGFTDVADGHRKVMHDLNQVVSRLGTFVQAYLYAALAKYNSGLEATVCAQVEGTKSNVVRLPYYIVEPPEGAASFAADKPKP
jgi:hypothetical protein